MTRRAKIGFDRRIDLEWLDAAAAQAAARTPTNETREYLWNLLDGVVSGDKVNSARGKTITVLNHIWGEAPGAAGALRQRAGSLFLNAAATDRLALHWAMTVGTYPVFTDVAAAIGRLLTLQGNFTLAHLTRRLVGSWGERSTLERAAQRIVRSMIQWDVLRDTTTHGVYEASSPRKKVGPAVGLILIEGLLVDAEETSISLDQLLGHPALFPFNVDVNTSQVRDSAHFQVHRQGLDSDFVELQANSDLRLK